MEQDGLPRTQPRNQANADAKRDEALARYDKHPGLAVLLLAAIAFLIVVAAYQLASAGPIVNGPGTAAEGAS